MTPFEKIADKCLEPIRDAQQGRGRKPTLTDAISTSRDLIVVALSNQRRQEAASVAAAFESAGKRASLDGTPYLPTEIIA